MEQREIACPNTDFISTQNPVPFYGNQIFGGVILLQIFDLIKQQKLLETRVLIGLEEAQQNWVDMWAEDGADEEEENRWIS
ncbi:hypothetical protein H5410_064534 [Solanum commersonii]|uniref:Uncharacterized protein n=1 Tax=Solanum commersonii TaxID=4109 RepID=A0A9J5VZ23_SOLCO|nr:hypothetical protein H5410_064534 [Solanum commersonii]